MDGTTVVAFLCIFSFSAFLVYMFFTTRNRERMALIESGQDAGIFNGLPKSVSALKWGLVLVSIGIGLGVGLYLDISYENDGPIATFPCAFISGGVGLLVFYFLVKDKDQV